MTHCLVCADEIGDKNFAIFPCGHSFHLSCVLTQVYKTTCSACETTDILPDIGSDREIAITANILSKIQSRQLKSYEPTSFVQKLSSLISPLTPQARTFFDHINHNSKMSVISNNGLSPVDAVQERIPWSKISSRYSCADILEFGFEWEHMVDMGIVPGQISKFSWSQQQHKLGLSAEKLLSIRMTISELAALKYTSHQLIEMGFDWSVMSRMGANVDTWKKFKFSLSDIKRYWSPSVSQLVAAGFYDKTRIQKAGWNIEDIQDTLPAISQRCAGRTLRLAF